MEKMAHSFFDKATEDSRVDPRVNFQFSIPPWRDKFFNFQFFRKLENLLLLTVVLLAAFLRLFRIGDYMTFLGDEGRDVLVAWGILHGDFTLLGPRSSAADFYYGPIYYYFITPFLWLFGYDPVGPAVMVALIGVVTVFLVYKTGREWFSSVYAGLGAGALYAVSPLVMAYSRSSWNPNPLPFVSLLSLFFLYKGISSQRLRLFFFAGILLGIGMQLQYLALFLAIVIAFYTFVGTWIALKRFDIATLAKRYLIIFCGFLFGFSPFLAFEIRNGFPNTRTIIRYIFTDELEPINYDQQPFFIIIGDVLFRLFARLITRFPPPEQVNIGLSPNLSIWYSATIALIIVCVVFLFKIKDKLVFSLLFVWLVLGIGLFGFYRDEIYDYHFGFMFPLPFLLAGNALRQIGQIRQIGWIGRMVGVSIFFLIFLFNLTGHPFQYLPNRQKDQVKNISEFVLSKTDGKPFNFALLTLGNSDHAYKYFMKIKGRDPVEIKNSMLDPDRQSVTDQLLVVCEDQNCKPLGNSLWEVAGFGRAEIVGEWTVSVVKVYKLRHYYSKTLNFTP